MKIVSRNSGKMVLSWIIFWIVLEERIVSRQPSTELKHRLNGFKNNILVLKLKREFWWRRSSSKKQRINQWGQRCRLSRPCSLTKMLSPLENRNGAREQKFLPSSISSVPVYHARCRKQSLRAILMRLLSFVQLWLMIKALGSQWGWNAFQIAFFDPAQWLPRFQMTQCLSHRKTLLRILKVTPHFFKL